MKSNAGRKVSICLAHLCNDWHTNCLQSLLPFLAAAGLMSGFGIGGLGVGLVGLLVEAMGIRYTIELLVWVPLVAGLAGLGIGTTGKPALGGGKASG
jgi:hypothetical protein